MIYSKPIVTDDISDFGKGLVQAIALVNKPLALKILDGFLPAPKSMVPDQKGRVKTVSFIPFTVQ